MLLSVLFGLTPFLLQWRFGFNWSDEGWLWYISQRTAMGQIPIRDFFSYDPGRYYWSALFFKLLHGNGLFEQLMANAAFGAVGLATIYFAMTGIELRRAWRIAILVVLAIMLGFPRHKTYEQALSLVCVGAIALVMSKPAAWRRWLVYGVITGLAAFVGRNSGLYFAIAALLLVLLVKFKRAQFAAGPTLLAYIAGVIVGYSPMIFMLCCVPGLASAFYQSLVFTPHWQLTLPIPFPWHLHVKGLSAVDTVQARAASLLCVLVPVAYLFVLGKWTKTNKTGDRSLRLAAAASLAGLPYLHHAFSRADFFHIAQSILPFAVMSGALSADLWQERRRQLSITCFSAALLLILAAWIPYEPAIQILRARPGTVEAIEIDNRDFYANPSQVEVMQVVADAFHKCGSRDASFLASPYYPGLYAFLATKAPFWDLYQLWPRDQAFQLSEIHLLKQNKVSLVLLNRQAALDGIDALRMDRTHAQLVEYITENYQRSDSTLPAGFELYYAPRLCRNALSKTR
jgi:hypothetical protein